MPCTGNWDHSCVGILSDGLEIEVIVRDIKLPNPSSAIEWSGVKS